MSPGKWFIILVLLFAIPMFLGGINRAIPEWALLLNVILLTIAVVDLFITPSPHSIDVERHVNQVLSVAAENPVTIQLRNKSRTPLSITVHDEPGPLAETMHLPQTVELLPWKEKSIHYTIRPLRRGENTLGSVHLRYPSRFLLWRRHATIPLETAVKIYPDIRAVSRFELLARQNRLSEIGIRTAPIPGQGRDFERLREFRYGDEVRQVDWKATARKQQIISREYNTERNQNIVIMVDCGRFMRNETDGISYLDRALNSAIMLSYIALGQGDNVSLMAFSNKVERFIRPVRGKPGIQSILHSTYDIQASHHAADYEMALEHLAVVQRKRALVLLITFITDELQLNVIGDCLTLKSLPWLPMCVLLQDIGIREMADHVPMDDLDAWHTAAAAQVLTGQTARAAALREAGLMIIDTPPDLLTERLINEYFVIKSRNLL